MSIVLQIGLASFLFGELFTKAIPPLGRYFSASYCSNCLIKLIRGSFSEATLENSRPISRWTKSIWYFQTPWLLDVFSGNEPEAAYFADRFDRLRAGQIPTWDYQVSFMMWANSGLAITPDVNLISNIGHGEGIGLYSKDPNMPFAFLPLVEMQFPLRHPPLVLRDLRADRQEYENNVAPVLRMESERDRLSTRLRRAIKRLLMMALGRRKRP